MFIIIYKWALASSSLCYVNEPEGTPVYQYILSIPQLLAQQFNMRSKVPLATATWQGLFPDTSACPAMIHSKLSITRGINYQQALIIKAS